jgi:hypothetical protein
LNRRACALLVAGLTTSLLSLSACDLLDVKHEPPENVDIGKAVGEMYLRAGLGSKVTTTKIVGKHYRPAQDSWKVVACVEFVVDEFGSTGRDCNDSFELYFMDSGEWMVNGTVDGTYRWLELPQSEFTNPGS